MGYSYRSVEMSKIIEKQLGFPSYARYGDDAEYTPKDLRKKRRRVDAKGLTQEMFMSK
eukprot:COSAG02_NODE_1588_length_11795_cov_1295.418348_11_plen_58_part_00